MSTLNLWNIDIGKHRIFDFTDYEPRQQREANKSHEVKPCVDEWEPIEHRYLMK